MLHLICIKKREREKNEKNMKRCNVIMHFCFVLASNITKMQIKSRLFSLIYINSKLR
jgi:hypothetical protein